MTSDRTDPTDANPARSEPADFLWADDRPAVSRAGETAPPYQAVRPRHMAPARVGVAGMSAGQHFKRAIDDDGFTARRTRPETFARALGWFSLGLGVAELVAADDIADWLGMSDKAEIVRIFGAREVATGLAILAQDDPPGHARWMRARVVGDVLDLATLANEYRHDDTPQPNRLAGAMLFVGGALLADTLVASLVSER